MYHSGLAAFTVLLDVRLLSTEKQYKDTEVIPSTRLQLTPTPIPPRWTFPAACAQRATPPARGGHGSLQPLDTCMPHNMQYLGL
jgi:hypothetical protein